MFCVTLCIVCLRDGQGYVPLDSITLTISDVFKQHPVRSQMASSILHFKTNDINVFFQSKQIEKDDNTKYIHFCVTLLKPILLETVEKSFTPF